MRKWNELEKLKQSELIRQTKPWEFSTGPKTQAGKERSKMNAFKHGACNAEIKSIIHRFASLKRILSKLV
jgi:hypothetical protein